MNRFDPRSTAQRNLRSLSENPYTGRGIIVGLDEEGTHLVQVYWIMGRSENSRNRVFVSGENGFLATEAANPSKVKDPSLIIYSAMRQVKSGIINGIHIVSNGNQTDHIWDGYHNYGIPFDDSLCDCSFEPDSPNFTPRISAISFWDNTGAVAWMSILRKSPWGDRACDRHFYQFDALGAGFGHCITTYSGDGDPLPSFEGEPVLLPLVGDIDEIASTYWASLNDEHRVSLAVKFIPKKGQSKIHIINKYTQVE